MRKISRLLTECEWVSSSNSCARVRWRHNEPFESRFALVCLARIDNKKIAQRQMQAQHKRIVHTYKHTYICTVFHRYVQMYVRVMYTHTHKPYPSISLQFFKKLTPLTIVAQQQWQRQQQRSQSTSATVKRCARRQANGSDASLSKTTSTSSPPSPSWTRCCNYFNIIFSLRHHYFLSLLIYLYVCLYCVSVYVCNSLYHLHTIVHTHAKANSWAQLSNTTAHRTCLCLYIHMYVCISVGAAAWLVRYGRVCVSSKSSITTTLELPTQFCWYPL